MSCMQRKERRFQGQSPSPLKTWILRTKVPKRFPQNSTRTSVTADKLDHNTHPIIGENQVCSRPHTQGGWGNGEGGLSSPVHARIFPRILCSAQELFSRTVNLKSVSWRQSICKRTQLEEESRFCTFPTCSMRAALQHMQASTIQSDLIKVPWLT